MSERKYLVDPATGRVAIRTLLEDSGPFVAHAYCVADEGTSPGYRSTLEVESWLDVTNEIQQVLAARAARMANYET